MNADDHYIIITADSHAGGSHAQYREFLDPKYRDDFDAWREKYKNPFKDLKDTDLRIRNWDSELRDAAAARATAIVGEVIFPNTVPPFFPSFVLFAQPPTPDEYEHRHAASRPTTAGWPTSCAEKPEARAGIGQIFLNDVDDAIADVAVVPGERAARRRARRLGAAHLRLAQAALRPVLRPAVGGVRGARRRR